MKTNKIIHTEIIIKSNQETIWNILTDTSKYTEWNPFIVEMKGEIKEGSKLINTMKNGNGSITFKPKVLKVVKHEYFEWLGHLFFPGLFDGLHFFKIEDLGNGHIKLTQGEKFTGIFSGIILKKIGKETTEKFITMNKAIQKKAEQK